jgi:hypothetical protein
MASWKKILAFDTSPTVNNSFVTVNTDDSVEVVSFNDLTVIPLSTYGSVSERLTEQSSNFMFAVHDILGQEHRKLTFDDIAGALTVSSINQVVDSGQGDLATFTGGTSGVLGDLDDDGSVGVSDLLEFLTLFGGSGDPVYDNGVINLTNCPSISPSNGGDGFIFSGDDADSSVLDQLEISNPTVTQGAFNIAVSTADDKITISEGSGLNWGGFTGKGIRIKKNVTSSKFVSNTGSAAGELWARIKTYNSTPALLATHWVRVTLVITASEDDAGEDIFMYANEDVLIGGSAQHSGVDLTFASVASVEIEFYFHDILGNITTCELENVGIDILVNL